MNVLVTAGPTREPIDAVRFISNRSSGQLGIAVARSAAAAGHTVVLLLGPVSDALTTDLGACEVLRFETTAELAKLLTHHFKEGFGGRGCDVLVMAAAVADYAPQVAHGKIKRKDAGTLELRLEATQDMVQNIAQHKRDDQRVVAFALEEPEQLEQRALAKMKRKGADAIIANPLGTMESDAIEAVLLTAKGDRQAPGPMSKTDFAAWLVQRLATL